MIYLTDDGRVKYQEDVAKYYTTIDNLKQISIPVKKIFLTEHFEPFPNNGSRGDNVAFITQFIDLIGPLTLFPDEEVLLKLRELKFSNHTLKWMVNLEDITDEINRLSKIDGLLIMPNSILTAASIYLSIKFLINSIEDFELTVNYNNEDTNFIFVDFDKRIRRREYSLKKMQTPKMNPYEQLMNISFDKLEQETGGDNDFAKKFLRQSAKGNLSFSDLIDGHYHYQGISRNKFYLEFFPLLKMIIKDKEMFSYEEYISRKEKYYDADYSKYQIARVIKILKKK
jgi:hypothetical protein